MDCITGFNIAPGAAGVHQELLGCGGVITSKESIDGVDADAGAEGVRV